MMSRNKFCGILSLIDLTEPTCGLGSIKAAVHEGAWKLFLFAFQCPVVTFVSVLASVRAQPPQNFRNPTQKFPWISGSSIDQTQVSEMNIFIQRLSPFLQLSTFFLNWSHLYTHGSMWVGNPITSIFYFQKNTRQEGPLRPITFSELSRIERC